MLTSPPPSPDPCLVASRRTRFRGGTLIAADVIDLAEHERRVRDGDGYRPAACPRCGCRRLHVHDRIERRLVGEARPDRTVVLRYICADRACRATWRVLPALVARHLWRRWSTVARAVVGGRASAGGAIPERTVRRWHSRLASAARQLVLLLAEHDDDAVARLARATGFDATRRSLVALFAAARAAGADAFAGIAAAVHQIERGVRLI